MRGKDDWGESMDDMDASDWENNFDGPTDRQLEDMYEQEEYEKEKYDELIKWEDREICYSQIANEAFEGRVRQQKIVQWLAESKFAIRFKKGRGFFIPIGPYISFVNGTNTDLFDWLREHGILGKKIIGNYSIAYTPPESVYGEKLSFFNRVIELPISPKPKSDEEPPPF